MTGQVASASSREVRPRSTWVSQNEARRAPKNRGCRVAVLDDALRCAPVVGVFGNHLVERPQELAVEQLGHRGAFRLAGAHVTGVETRLAILGEGERVDGGLGGLGREVGGVDDGPEDERFVSGNACLRADGEHGALRVAHQLLGGGPQQ
jgi:hypothetical protein